MKNSKIKYTNIVFWVVSILLAAAMFMFFRINTITTDFLPHTWFADTLLGGTHPHDPGFPEQAVNYPLYHYVLRILKIVSRLDYDTCVGILMAITFIASFVLYRILFMYLLKPENAISKYFIDYISIAACYFMVVRCPLNEWSFYKYQCGPNPFHNPTIIFVRPLGIACIYFFIRFVDEYKAGRKYVMPLMWFGLFSILADISKPSFNIVVLPAMGVYILVMMIQRKELKVGILAFAAVLPTIILCLLQFTTTTSDDIGTEFRVAFGSFLEMSPQRVLIVSLLTFPAPILIFFMKKVKKDAIWYVGYISLVVGWAEMFLLTNGPYGDLSWGYDLAIQIATVIALFVAHRALLENKTVYNRIFAYASYALFAYQLYTGLLYYYIGYTQGKYWL